MRFSDNVEIADFRNVRFLGLPAEISLNFILRIVGYWAGYTEYADVRPDSGGCLLHERALILNPTISAYELQRGLNKY